MAHNSLSLNDTAIKMQPKAMAVLHYLALHQDRVISAQELMEQLWAGRIVTQGSVQKSINSIRSALAELAPQQEFIAYYSKRGYQLQISAKFENIQVATEPPTSMDSEQQAAEPITHQTTPMPASRKRLGLVLGGLLLVTAITGYFWQQGQPLQKHHKTQFTQQIDYTNAQGHEGSPAPHPDKSHVAYITERYINDAGDTESRLLIRDPLGQDWQLAISQGTWFKLAWSPSGTQLAALEVKPIDGRSLHADFYEKDNFIYSFHLFTLDVERHQVLEKQTLSQWQGRIFSLSWWDDNNLDIVAKQGPTAKSARYRYDSSKQQLTAIDEIDGAANPTASSVNNGWTALASKHGNKTQIDFLDRNQQSKGRYLLDYPQIDISWLPDGSGILAFAEESQSLFILYRDGTQATIELKQRAGNHFSSAIYGPSGDKIFLTQEQPNVQLQQLTPGGELQTITQKQDTAATYSPDGKSIAFTAGRDNTLHLWLWNQGKEQQLTKTPLPDKIGSMAWHPNGQSLFFTAGNSLYEFSIPQLSLLLLHQANEKVDVIGFLERSQQLLFVKTQGEVKNLWALHLQSHQEKQLTFGSLAGVITQKDEVYLQYLNQPGLWKISARDNNPVNAYPNFPANVKLISVVNQQLFYVIGGTCRESNLLQLDLLSGTTTTAQTANSHLTNTTSYHPNQGLLQTRCEIPEANVVVLE